MFDPLQVRNVFLHPGGAVLFHALRHVAVNIQSKGCCGVSQVSLDGFHVVPILEREDGEGVTKIVYPAIWGTNLDGQLLIVSDYRPSEG